MNRIIRYTYPYRNQWSGLSQVDRLFQVALADLGAPSRFAVDLYEDQDNTFVRAELPGFDREAINIELVDGVLNLSASRQDGDSSATLSRAIALPDAVQADKVTAAYENGVLTVTLPKQEAAKPRKINIAIN